MTAQRESTALAARFSSARRQLHNIAIYLAFSVVTSAIGFASVMVLTRLLAPSDYGLIGVFFSLLFFVAPLVSLSADGLIGVNRTTLDSERFLVFQRTYIGMSYVCFAAIQVLFLIAWAANLYDNLLFAGVPLLGLVRFLASMAATEYVLEQRPVAFGMMTVLTSAFSLVLTVVLIKLFGAWGGFRVLAMLTADFAMLAVRYHGRLRLLAQPCWHRDFVAQVLAFGLPSLAAVAGGWCLNEADKVIVANAAGMEAAGLYAAVAGLAAIMLTFNQSLTNALYPEMFRRLARGADTWPILARYAATFVVLSCAFCVIVIGAYYLVADMLLPPRYLVGSNVFVALMLSGIAVSLYRPFGLLTEYFRLARIRAAAILVGGVVTFVVADVGVRHAGLLWAPIGIACGYICTTIALAVGIVWYESKR